MAGRWLRQGWGEEGLSSALGQAMAEVCQVLTVLTWVMLERPIR